MKQSYISNNISNNNHNQSENGNRFQSVSDNKKHTAQYKMCRFNESETNIFNEMQKIDSQSNESRSNTPNNTGNNKFQKSAMKSQKKTNEVALSEMSNGSSTSNLEINTSQQSTNKRRNKNFFSRSHLSNSNTINRENSFMRKFSTRHINNNTNYRTEVENSQIANGKNESTKLIDNDEEQTAYSTYAEKSSEHNTRLQMSSKSNINEENSNGHFASETLTGSFKKKFKSLSKNSVVSTTSFNECITGSSLLNKIIAKCNYFVLSPDENFMFLWLIILSACVLYNFWIIIARQSFDPFQTNYKTYWLVIDAIADFIYLLDILVQFRTGYLEQGLLVYDSKKLARNYVESKKVYFDIISVLPLDLLQLKLENDLPILRFPRFIKAYRSFQLYYMQESRTLYPNFWRVLNLTHILVLLGHWFAGFYFMISKAENHVSEWSVKMNGNETTLMKMYLRSLYWAVLTLTTIGDLPPPETNWQWLRHMTNGRYIFTIAAHYLAVFVIALIVGQVGNVITNRNASRVEFERLLDGAKQYMRSHNVPTEMQRRVQRWYDYSWSRGRMNGSGDIHSIGLLPDKLKTELALHVNLDTLRKVSIFHECQPEFLHDLVLKMRAFIFTPGDMICRRGEVAREMFIIADGVLEVIGENGHVLTKMYAGDFFGEIGILNMEGCSNKRTADVRSVGYAELFSLSKEDVLSAVKDYPEAERILVDYGRRRLKQNLAKSTSVLNLNTNKHNQINSALNDVIININEAAMNNGIHRKKDSCVLESEFTSDDKLISEAIMSIQSSEKEIKKCQAHPVTDHPGLETDIFGFPTKSNDKSPTRVTFEASKAIEFLRRNNSNYFIDLFSKNETLESQVIESFQIILNKLKEDIYIEYIQKFKVLEESNAKKDSKIKLLESRIKILQKYLTQKST